MNEAKPYNGEPFGEPQYVIVLRQILFFHRNEVIEHFKLYKYFTEEAVDDLWHCGYLKWK